MWNFLYKLASPKNFYALSEKWLPWIWGIVAIAFSIGIVGGLWLAPADYQQGDAFRIIYIHVPAAFLSLMVFSVMTFCAVLALIWHIKLAEVVLTVSAPLGAWFAVLALITGAIWGKPMWGTYWVWDARLTSELILLFIYLAIIALGNSIRDQQMATKAMAVLTVVGFIDIPVIHYSVKWWNTLHQGSTLKIFQQSLIANSMLYPLLAMIIAFVFYYIALLLQRMRSELLWRDRNKNWVKESMIC